MFFVMTTATFSSTLSPQAPTSWVRACKGCNHEFETVMHNQRYCNRMCRNAARASYNRENGTGNPLSEAQQRRVRRAAAICPRKSKMRFVSSQDAWKAREENGDLSVEPYVCICKHIHLGHNRHGKHYSMPEGTDIKAPITQTFTYRMKMIFSGGTYRV